MLKADLHIHTGEDIRDNIRYSATELVDRAAKLAFHVLAISNHERIFFNEHLARHAESKGILMIPAIEALLDGSHVVILNAPKSTETLRSLADLKAFRKDNPDIFILAPHPFYPKSRCLGQDLIDNIDLFDAIELCHYNAWPFSRFNKKAEITAAEHKKPLIGTSDAHTFWQFGKTYTLVDASPDIPSIINALKNGRTQVVSSKLSLATCSKIIATMVVNKKLRSRKHPPGGTP